MYLNLITLKTPSFRSWTVPETCSSLKVSVAQTHDNYSLFNLTITAKFVIYEIYYNLTSTPEINPANSYGTIISATLDTSFRKITSSSFTAYLEHVPSEVDPQEPGYGFGPPPLMGYQSHPLSQNKYNLTTGEIEFRYAGVSSPGYYRLVIVNS